MHKMSRSVKNQLEMAVAQALAQSQRQGWALTGMVFFAVAREGLESVLFLLAAFSQDVGIAAPIGAVLGLACAIALGMVMYWTGIRLPLATMFQMDQRVYFVCRRRACRRRDPRVP